MSRAVVHTFLSLGLRTGLSLSPPVIWSLEDKSQLYLEAGYRLGLFLFFLIISSSYIRAYIRLPAVLGWGVARETLIQCGDLP